MSYGFYNPSEKGNAQNRVSQEPSLSVIQFLEVP